MTAVVIGVGNPLLGDDGVGFSVVGRLRRLLGEREGVRFLEIGNGGLALMEAMAGYGRAHVVDAMVTGRHEPGTIRLFRPGELPATRHALSSHDADFVAACDAGRALGMPLPREVHFWGVEAEDVTRFREELSPPVAAAVPRLAAAIAAALAPQGESA